MQSEMEASGLEEAGVNCTLVGTRKHILTHKKVSNSRVTMPESVDAKSDYGHFQLSEQNADGCI